MIELLPDIVNLQEQLDAAERDARLLVQNLDDERGCWRAKADSWSVAQCFDHLAAANEVYLSAMKGPAIRARAAGQMRRRPALPGFVGQWFVKKMEPPLKESFKTKAPRKIKPDSSPLLSDAFDRFLRSQDEVRDYIRTNADLDLAVIRFPNPLVSGIRFSIATGLHVISAHERRHLRQAWGVRHGAEAR
ncbi:DinB family protein [Tunturiibacter psychrotolerans]|uniref:DinB family protein n=1 Tax=Tunturiibacter psychrotolerans TaxID=3069686 RepID=UPI003D2389D9